MKKSELREIIKEEIKNFINEEEYDTLRDKYGRIGKRKPKKGTVPPENKLYLDISDTEGKEYEKASRGRIRKDDKGWFMNVPGSPKQLPSHIKKAVDTDKTHKDMLKRLK